METRPDQPDQSKATKTGHAKVEMQSGDPRNDTQGLCWSTITDIAIWSRAEEEG